MALALDLPEPIAMPLAAIAESEAAIAMNREAALILSSAGNSLQNQRLATFIQDLCRVVHMIVQREQG